MAARHTNADLYHQWEEAEEKAEKWEAKAREERELRKREVADVKAEMRAILAEYKEETKIQEDAKMEEEKANGAEIEDKRMQEVKEGMMGMCRNELVTDEDIALVVTKGVVDSSVNYFYQSDW